MLENKEFYTVEESGYEVEAIGPFYRSDYTIRYLGCQVPFIEAAKCKEPEAMEGATEGWFLSLDNRILMIATDKELQELIPVVANLMAVAGGYSRFGKEGVKLNPFGKFRLHDKTTEPNPKYANVPPSPEVHRMICEGREVPYLDLIDQGDSWLAIINSDYSYPISKSLLDKAASWIFAAMAVAAGLAFYTQEQPFNRFATGMSGIG